MAILQMDTGVVRSAMQQMRSDIETMQQQMASSQQAAGGVDWQGPAREQFVQDYQAAAARVSELLRAGDELAQRVDREVSQWEELANLASSSAAGGSIAVGGGAVVGVGSNQVSGVDQSLFGKFDIGKFLSGELKLTGEAKNWAERLIIPAFLLTNFHVGLNGLVHLTGPEWAKKFLLGLPGKYTISHANTILDKVTKANVLVEAAFLGFNWVTDVIDNKDKGWEAVGKAMVKSSGKAVGGVVGGVAGGTIGGFLGATAGKTIGGAIGSVLIPVPVVGTAVGMIVGSVAGEVVGKVGGSVIGSIAGEYLGEKAAEGLMNYKPIWDSTTIDESIHNILDKPASSALNWVNGFI